MNPVAAANAVGPAPPAANAAKSVAPASAAINSPAASAAINPPAASAAMAATAQAFEAVLIGQMTKLMMDSSEAGGDFSGGHGEAMFRGVLAEQIGSEIARRGGLGLAPAVLHQIILLQTGNGPP